MAYDDDNRRYGRGYRDDRYDQNRYRSDYRSGSGGGNRYRGGGYGNPPSDYDYDDRGFFERAGDEVRSWFGDEEAERRREYDMRMRERYDREQGYGRDNRYGNEDRYGSGSRSGRYSGRWQDQPGYSGIGHGYGAGTQSFGAGGGIGSSYSRGSGGYQPYTGQPNAGTANSNYDAYEGAISDHDDYHSWRQDQIGQLDRDYEEYRRENRDRFHNEFGSWRDKRNTQRSSLSQVKEHMEVVGSDGSHIGTVDKVRGDRIILTKSDRDAHGHHHSIPSRWINEVDEKVHVSKTADEAKAAWRDEENRQSTFGEDYGDDDSRRPRYMNRSFRGTY